MMSIHDIANEYKRALELLDCGAVSDAVRLCLVLHDELENLQDFHDLPSDIAMPNSEDLAFYCFYTYAVCHLLFYHLEDSGKQSASSLTYGHLAVNAVRIMHRNQLATFNIPDVDVATIQYDISQQYATSGNTKKAAEGLREALDCIAHAIERTWPDPMLVWLRGTCLTQLVALLSGDDLSTATSGEIKALAFQAIDSLAQGIIAIHNEEAVDYFIFWIPTLLEDAADDQDGELRLFRHIIGQIEDFVPLPDPDDDGLANVIRPMPKTYFSPDTFLIIDYVRPPCKKSSDPLTTILAFLYHISASKTAVQGSIAASLQLSNRALEYLAPADAPLWLALYMLNDRRYWLVISGEVSEARSCDDHFVRLTEREDFEPEELYDIISSSALMEADFALLELNHAQAVAAYDRVTQAAGFNPQRPEHLWARCIALINQSYFVDHREGEELVEAAEALLQNDSSDTNERLKPYLLLARSNLSNGYWSIRPGDDCLPNMSLNMSESDLEELFILHEIAFQKQNPSDQQRVCSALLLRGVSTDYLKALEWMYDGGKGGWRDSR